MRLNSWIIAFLVALVVICACVVYGIAAHASLPRMEPLTATYTADNDIIKAFVLIDPDTKIQYIVTDHGGITPRL